MRILVISDTHRRIGRVMDLLTGDHRFDRIIHLGDLVHDAEDIDSFCGIPIDSVAGNCDWGVSGKPYHKVLHLEGKRIYICHGHREHVKFGDSMLRQLIRQDRYDVVLYGHTHMADVVWEGDSIIMNPGSISQPRDGYPSYGVIHIDEQGRIHSNIVRIK